MQSYELLNEALNERNYFLQAAPYLNKDLKLLIPNKSLFSSLFYWAGAFGYHLLYLKSGFGHDYKETLSGPSIVSQRGIKR